MDISKKSKRNNFACKRKKILRNNYQKQNSTEEIYNGWRKNETLDSVPFERNALTNADVRGNNELVQLLNDTELEENEILSEQRRKKEYENDLLSELHQNYEERKLLMQQLLIQDDVNAFCASLACTIKKFPPLRRAQVKRQLFKIVSDVEIELEMENA